MWVKHLQSVGEAMANLGKVAYWEKVGLVLPSLVVTVEEDPRLGGSCAEPMHADLPP